MVFFEKSTLSGAQNSAPEIGRFRIVLWFAIVSFVLIALNTMLFSAIVTDKVSARILERDAQVSSQYANSIVRIAGAASYFHGDTYNPKAPEMEAFFRQVSSLPEVLRANVYGQDRRILWSSDVELIGTAFPKNDLLELAFAGVSKPEVEYPEEHEEDDDAGLPSDITSFIEVYLPIWATDRSQVVGVVEVYKSTGSLFDEIASIRYAIWIGSTLGAIVLFASLLSIMILVRRIISEQEQRIVDSEKYAVIGEMTSAVAHGLRNPLAAIRSSAELALDDDLPDSVREPITDIVVQSERLDVWIRSFLTQAREAGKLGPAPIMLDDVLSDCIAGFSHQLEARSIRLTFEPEGQSPIVAVKKSELVQVFNALFSNAIEAISHDGEITLSRTTGSDGAVSVIVEDDGPGVSQDLANKLFRPFSTGKGTGLGVGLSLTKRIIDRCGGTIDLVNRTLRGVRVTVKLPAAGG